MTSDDLLNVPFAERRGCWQDDCGNTWEAVLLAGDIDFVSTTLQANASVGLVKRGVTKEVLSGKCPSPDGKWALLIKLVGTDWVHFVDPSVLNPFTRYLNTAMRLAAESGLTVLQTGYQDTANATYVVVHAAGEEDLVFESTGAGFGEHCEADSDRHDTEDDDYEDPFDVTTLKSNHYPQEWWRQFKNEEEVQQALLRALNAYVPFLQAYPQDYAIHLAACHDDAVLPKHVERIDLLVFGPNASAEPNLASRDLRSAIEAGNVDGVEKAVAEGANLSELPEITCSPLNYAIQKLRPDHSDGVKVVKALVAAGVLSETAEAKDSPLFEAIKKAKTSPEQAAEAITMLLEAGADINKQGKLTLFGGGTPLHQAVQVQSLSAIMLLCAYGADLNATDPRGNTPLERALGMLESVHEHLEGTLAEKKSKPIVEIVEYLQQASQGTHSLDWRMQLEVDRKLSVRERRRMLVAGEKFTRRMNNLGKKMDALEEEEQLAERRAVEVQPDQIHLRPLDSATPWPNVKHRDMVTQQLSALGFEQVGDYTVEEMSTTFIRALVHRLDRMYAAICTVAGSANWIDLVQFFPDGNVLTVTNAPIDPRVNQIAGDTRHKKIDCEGAESKELYQRLKKELGEREALPLVAEEFTHRFEKFYSEDIAAKKSTQE